MTNISLAILAALHEHKEIDGTETLCQHINTNDKHHVFTNALLLAKYGLIEMIISPGGRGHKTIYKDRGVLEVKR